jgi:Zn-dependent protease with chaperone function
VTPIAGRFFDGVTTGARAATLTIGVDYLVRLEGAGVEPRSVALARVSVSDRIAHLPRRVSFEDGAVFETADNDAVDAALAALGSHGFMHDVGRWERCWGIAVASLVAVAVLSWAFVRFGVPALANAAARTLPPAVDRAIGAEGLEILDRSLLAPSELPAERRQALMRAFATMTAPLDDGHVYRLELRDAPAVGPNAFALPSGIIVMTDQLVELAKHDDEIRAVLAHEIGHVRGRHSLRMILQSAGVAALALALLGDVGSVSALAASLPTALLQAAHSREFEHEADEFAREWLRENGVDARRFDAILCRLTAEDEPSASGGPLSYLASHPSPEERARCR